MPEVCRSACHVGCGEQIVRLCPWIGCSRRSGDTECSRIDDWTARCIGFVFFMGLCNCGGRAAHAAFRSRLGDPRPCRTRAGDPSPRRHGDKCGLVPLVRPRRSQRLGRERPLRHPGRVGLASTRGCMPRPRARATRRVLRSQRGDQQGASGQVLQKSGLFGRRPWCALGQPPQGPHPSGRTARRVQPQLRTDSLPQHDGPLQIAFGQQLDEDPCMQGRMVERRLLRFVAAPEPDQIGNEYAPGRRLGLKPAQHLGEAGAPARMAMEQQPVDRATRGAMGCLLYTSPSPRD